MTCEEALARLDDFVDGELEEAEFQEIELHLAACGTCAQEARELRALVEQAAGLPRARAPQRDLWPGIAARLQSPAVTRARINQPWAWGTLAAAAAIVLGVLLWRGNGRVAPLPTLTPGNTAQPASLQADQDYERAASELLAAVATRRDRLTPEAQARVDESLRVIAQALAAIRSELAKDPGSPALNHLLVSVHQRRIEVLRTLVNLTA
jgi:anti-sigma factor RsiW